LAIEVYHIALEESRAIKKLQNERNEREAHFFHSAAHADCAYADAHVCSDFSLTGQAPKPDWRIRLDIGKGTIHASMRPSFLACE
jgi:hypothetical protein